VLFSVHTGTAYNGFLLVIQQNVIHRANVLNCSQICAHPTDYQVCKTVIFDVHVHNSCR